MASYTLPAPIAIDKNIREAVLPMEFSVLGPYPADPPDVGEIAIHLRMQVRQFEMNSARRRGVGQRCATVDQCAIKGSLFEFICQNAAQRSHVVLLLGSQPHLLDLNQRRRILWLTRWATRAVRQGTQKQPAKDHFHWHSILAVRRQPQDI